MDNILKNSGDTVDHIHLKYMFILIYLCLPEVDLEEGQSCPRICIPPTSKNLGIFANLCTNSIIKCNFCTST